MELLTRSTPFSKRQITDSDRTLFKRDPTKFVNKRFILGTGDGTGDDTLYELVEVSFKKGGWEYYVRFEGCMDSIAMFEQEMMEMLSTSALFETTEASGHQPEGKSPSQTTSTLQ